MWLVAWLVGFWYVLAQGMFFWLMWRYRAKPGVRAEYVTGKAISGDVLGSMLGRCRVAATYRDPSGQPRWTGWSPDTTNTRFQTAAQAGLAAGDVPRLKLKWAFGFPGATALYSQTVYDGRLYVTSNAGYVYSLDAETGCIHWSFRSQSAVRSGFVIGRMGRTVSRLAVYFGDIRGTAYALDASTGAVLWTRATDPHPLARITGTPVVACARRPDFTIAGMSGEASMRSP